METLLRIRVKDSGFRKPAIEVRLEPLPVPTRPGFVAASSDRFQPEAGDLIAELGKACVVSGDGMIREPPLDDTLEPRPLHVQGEVHLAAQLRFDSLQRRADAFGYADTGDLECAAAGSPAAVSEPKKIERRGFTVSSTFVVSQRKPPEFKQTCLLRVKREAELFHPPAQFSQAAFGVFPKFKAHDEVVRVANDDDVASRVLLTPLLYPQVQYIVLSKNP